MNRKIGVGVLWNFASLLFSRGANTIFILFLARILAPEAFGLVAMSAVVFELANGFITSGLGAALIRSKEISDADLDTVFYTNLGLSLAAYVLIFFGAPYVAKFYNQSELTLLLQVMAFVVFINATKVVQSAVLSRRMDFKTQMMANTLATLISGILAVTAAYQGWGVWSLVVQMLSYAAVSAVVLWMKSNWLPGRKFSSESFSRLFSFGKNLLVERLLQVAFQNSYILVIGRYYSAELTGLYFFARKISKLISEQLTGAVQQATFPALSTLQSDGATLLVKYRQIMQLMMFIITPIMGMLACLAPTIFLLFFDPRWADAVPYLQLLCVVGALYPLHALNMNLLNVKGRSDLVLKVGLVKKAISLALLFLSIPYGVIGIVFSQVLSSLIALVPNTYFSLRLANYSLATQLKDAGKPFLGAVAAAVTVWNIQLYIPPNGVYLMLLAIFGLCVYSLLCFIIKAEGGILLWRQAEAKFSQKRHAGN